MRTIFKYPLLQSPLEVQGTILRLLKVGEQNGELFIWIMIDDEGETETIDPYIVGTGHKVPGELTRFDFFDIRSKTFSMILDKKHTIF